MREICFSQKWVLAHFLTTLLAPFFAFFSFFFCSLIAGNVLGKLQIQVTRPSYDTWLKETVGLSCISGEMVIGVPNAFVAEMLDRRMHSLISKTLTDVLGKEHTLRFEIAGSVSPAEHDDVESPFSQLEERQPAHPHLVSDSEPKERERERERERFS